MQPRECLWKLLSVSHRSNSAVKIANGVFMKLFLLAGYVLRWLTYVRYNPKFHPQTVTVVITSFSSL